MQTSSSEHRPVITTLAFSILLRISAMHYLSMLLIKWVKRLMASKPSMVHSKIWMSRIWLTTTRRSYRLVHLALVKPSASLHQSWLTRSMRKLILKLHSSQREPRVLTMDGYNPVQSMSFNRMSVSRKKPPSQSLRERRSTQSKLSCLLTSSGNYLSRTLARLFANKTRTCSGNSSAASSLPLLRRLINISGRRILKTRKLPFNSSST